MKPADVLKKADNIIRFLLKTVTLCMFAVLMIMIALNVFNRLVPITSFHWLDEIIELCFAAMTFYGAAAVWIIKGHYSVGNWLENRITPPAGKAFLRINFFLRFFCTSPNCERWHSSKINTTWRP